MAVEEKFDTIKIDDIEEDYHETISQNRRNLFHQFQCMFLPKKCLVCIVILQLIIQHDCLFADEDCKHHPRILEARRASLPLY